MNYVKLSTTPKSMLGGALKECSGSEGKPNLIDFPLIRKNYVGFIVLHWLLRCSVPRLPIDEDGWGPKVAAAPIRYRRPKRIGDSDEKKRWIEGASIRHSTAAAEANRADDADVGNDENRTPRTAAGNKPRKQVWQNNGIVITCVPYTK